VQIGVKNCYHNASFKFTDNQFGEFEAVSNNNKNMTTFDQKEFRKTLGTFATGITVVTAMHENSVPVGITVNSFTSVSLDPPLILWCLDNEAESYKVFANCKNFAIHILHQEQEAISQTFATKGSDKFSGLEWETGELGSPILKDCASYFQCETETSYEGGDHIILLGRVKAVQTNADKQPLIYHASNYHSLKAL
jgi:flavin reductase (DIM6/NTAB) family NADH-FMN oxidoreductase RutF